MGEIRENLIFQIRAVNILFSIPIRKNHPAIDEEVKIEIVHFKDFSINPGY